MSSPLNAIYNGTFTTDATPSPVVLNLPSGATEVEIVNLTDYNTTSNRIIIAKGYASSAPDKAVTKTGNAGTPNVLTERVVATGGFTFFQDSATQPIGAAVAITAITNASPPVASSASTAVVGDVVRIYGTTGQLQYASMDFTVTAVNPGVTQTLGWTFLNSAGYAAATAGFMRILPMQRVALASGAFAPNPRYYPRIRTITSITRANPCVVTMSVAHAFQIGEKVRIYIPREYGMQELDGFLATITATNPGTNTITLDIDSTAFTAFAFPTSAFAATGSDFAQVIPVGEAAVNTIALPVANVLDDRTRNVSVNGVIISAGLLVATTNYSWIAKKGLTI